MEPIALQDLARTIAGDALDLPSVAAVDVTIDSRRVGVDSAFFALPGNITDGHNHVREALRNGAVVAVVARSRHASLDVGRGSPLIVVDDPLVALQRLATWWRSRLTGLLVAITGSNGKTVTKDALLACLAGSTSAAGSIGSYNSQLGVPLALLRLPRTNDVAVMEAGVSAPNEMQSLRAMLTPNCGILTNIGVAHIAAFGSRDAIAAEKMQLFRDLPASGWLLVPGDEPTLTTAYDALSCDVIRLGHENDRVPWVETVDSSQPDLRYMLRFPGGAQFSLRSATPSTDLLRDFEAAAAAAYLLGVEPAAIAHALDGHAPASTRMEIWRSSTAGITIINDSCSADPVSVRAALRSLANLSERAERRVFVFGGMRQLGELDRSEHEAIGRMAAQHAVSCLVLLGGSELDPVEAGFRAERADAAVVRCADPERLHSMIAGILGDGDVVLFKGPRDARIDVVARQLVESIAPNRLVVDLGAVAENIRVFRRHIGGGRRIMAMVKALAYGSDLVRLGIELQSIGVDFLGVSTPDEGIQLRRAGVDLPILVGLTTTHEADKVARYRLTAALYSQDLVEPLTAAARAYGQPLPVHIKVDTGMGRLGVLPGAVLDLANAATASEWLRVTGLMTHFGCADDPAQDATTERQIEVFERARLQLRKAGMHDLICHAANTSAAVRFPHSHYDMVRVGLGLFGVYPSAAVERALELRLAVSLRSRVSEIRTLPRGARIGYGGSFEVEQDSIRVGVVPIGYHDGVPWVIGGRGQVMIGGHLAPIVGRISMDSLTVDLTAMPDVERGAEVVVYGEDPCGTLRPEAVAEQAGTIVYELLARIQGRVQRIFLGA